MVFVRILLLLLLQLPNFHGAPPSDPALRNKWHGYSLPPVFNATVIDLTPVPNATVIDLTPVPNATVIDLTPVPNATVIDLTPVPNATVIDLTPVPNATVIDLTPVPNATVIDLTPVPNATVVDLTLGPNVTQSALPPIPNSSLSLPFRIYGHTRSLLPNASLPLPPYLHPYLRIKRGVEGFLPRGEDLLPPGDGMDLLNPDEQRKPSSVQVEEKEKKKECYFKRHRTTYFETEPRPSVSEVKEPCGGELIRMSELIDSQYPNQYGSPNSGALVLERGAGEMHDWNDKETIRQVGKRFICRNHERELGSDWENARRRHFKTTEKAGRSRMQCSMTHPFFQHHEPFTLYHSVHRVEAEEAEAILIRKGVLIHPGLPICDRHNREASRIRVQVEVERAGHDIRPPPIGGDFSKTPDITRNVNPFFDPRDPKDPSYIYHKSKPPMEDETLEGASETEIRNAYIAFMHALGLSPHISAKEWHELSERAQRRKTHALCYVTDKIASLMNPDDPTSLKEKAFKPATDYERTRTAIYEGMMMTVKEAHDSAVSRFDRLAFLAMVANRAPLHEIQRYIPGLSRYYYTLARRYARRGYQHLSGAHRRIKYVFAKVERFLEFFTSYKITIGLPYGMRRVKDTQGRWVEIPNTLRNLRSGEIYRLYRTELEDRHETSLLIPESTVRKMIHICAAEKRKSLHGVDVIVADGMEAFEDMEALFEKLHEKDWIKKDWQAHLRSLNLQGRQYLRTDYLLHAHENSKSADHCWTFGLSDPKDHAFRMNCELGIPKFKHEHSQVCNRCEVLKVLFGDVRATLEQLERKFKKDQKLVREITIMQRDAYDWEDKITKLKAHQLRTAKAENDKQSIISGLKDGDALITLDFAMKHMPIQGREPTTDWYGQRGMPWHISHVTTVREGLFYQHRLVHIFEKSERQDSATVTAVLHHGLEILKSKGINRVYLRSDQAGCYKSSSTLASVQSIANEVGITVVGWYFSEAQAGKGPCDRCAAEVKMITRAYADSGKKVLDPQQFFIAVTTGRIYDGISYFLARVEGSGVNKKPQLSKSKIDDMSKLNAFTFEKNNLRVHRYWNIGEGKSISYSKLKPNNARLHVDPKNFGGALGASFWQKLGEPHLEPKGHPEDDEEDGHSEEHDGKPPAKKSKLESKLYRCPVETCLKEFLYEKNLQHHMEVGKHDEIIEKENVQDYTLHRFKYILEHAETPKMCPIIDEAFDSLEENNDNGRLPLEGWALPTRRPSTPFPPEVKQFLKRIYDEGERTGEKTDAREASKMMRSATKKDGSMLFEPMDLLSSRQVAGVYAGFKRTKIEKRERVEAGIPEEMEERDEVNDLFKTEGDPDLEYKTEPLFDEKELMRSALVKNPDVFNGQTDVHERIIKKEPINDPKRGWMGPLNPLKK